MKQLKNIILCALCLLLTGCQSKTKVDPTLSNAWTCTQSTTVIRIENNNDTLQKTQQVFILPYDAIQTDSSSSPDQAKQEALALCEQMFQDLNGVTFQGEAQETGIQCTLTIDYAKADLSQLKDASLTEQLGLKEGYISLSDTIDKLESDGFACQAVNP
ncbi:DUF1307 domain-containing protein [Erysipelotrichaceae bacterium RD49]|nr:DUF1307 domain-containing protein [Erysipelotrichaceae bacterium RD49]